MKKSAPLNGQMKFSGFTLIEILIGLVISGILLAMAVQVVTTILSVGAVQNRNSKQNDDLLLVYSVLNQNFRYSSSIESNEDSDLKFIYPDKRNVTISFRDSIIIISKHLHLDTVSIPWEGMRITRTHNQLVDRLSFSVHFNNIDYPFKITKEYTNQDLFNSERNAD